MIVPAIIAFVDEGLGNSSYLVDLGDGRALAVDPSRDPSPYQSAAEHHGLTISHTAETHLHADFVTGSRQLAARGATVLASSSAGIEWPIQGMGDGDQVDLGGLTLRALATPGHTPEHMAYLLLDGERPIGLFSGGSLLVGSVARTDLIDPDETEDLARALWHSIYEQLLVLPDDLAVYPTHGAGSFCSAPAGGERTTTIGRERTSNPLLAAENEDTFVTRLLGGLGTYPPYFRELREINRRGPRVYAKFPDLAELDLSQVHLLVDAGAALVDVRHIDDFGASHIPGSLSIELRPQFASWLGWLVERDQPVVFVTDAGTDRRELVRQCLTIGYERIAGELAGGIAAWTGPIGHIGLVRVEEVSGPILDIRQDAEYNAGHVPGATHVELGALTAAGGQVESGPMTVMCGHGERAMTAASVLAAVGRRDITVAVGGPPDWASATGRTLSTGR